MRIFRLCCILACLVAASASRAATPSPLDLTNFYAFPGAVAGPASAMSAGLAFADRWLGDEPFDNPAAAPIRGVMGAPVLQRVKRQDLPADYRTYEQTDGYFDFAGGWLSLPVAGFGVTAYISQPVLRLEDQTFTTKPGETPANAYASSWTARELRAGLALSREWRGTRFGVAAEWTRREDSYETSATSGLLTGTSHVDFSGDAVGFQAGARMPVVDRVVVGAALRYLPELEVTGRQSVEALALAQDVTATREAGWEGGVSACLLLSDAVRTFASLGGGTARSWEGFDLREGRAIRWSAGLEYDEPDQPLIIRCGVGQEQQSGTPEPRAGAYALGFGWRFDPLRLDVGVLRRTLARAGHSASYDDRVVASLTVAI